MNAAIVQHTCSAKTQERCFACGHVDTRDAFQGYEEAKHGGSIYFVRCPECEAPHRDQEDHDDNRCDACWEEEF